MKPRKFLIPFAPVVVCALLSACASPNLPGARSHIRPTPDAADAIPEATQPATVAPPAPAATASAAKTDTTPVPSAEEEVRRIAQENLERAERMQRMLDMGDPQRRVGPPPPPYVPPAAAAVSATAAATGSTPEHVNRALLHGYTAFNNGDFATAHQQYQAVLQQDANNRDALLGIAALALRERQPEQAAAIYSRLLELDPNDSDALAGLRYSIKARQH